MISIKSVVDHLRHLNNRKILLWIASTTALYVLLPVYPALAFDPAVASNRVFSILQYVIVIAVIIGALKAISKVQILAAFLAVIAGAVIYSMVEPEMFRSIGSDILSYLSIIGGGGAAPALDPAPISNAPTAPAP